MMGTSAVESQTVTTTSDSKKVKGHQTESSAGKSDSAIEQASSCPPENILYQCNNLIKDAKNFNLHANILKQLLNLKDRSSGYDLYARRPSNPTTSPQVISSDSVIIKNNDEKAINLSQSSSPSVFSSIELERLVEAVDKLREEVQESHRLGFCLVYNIQCLHKRLTGSPIDIHSSNNLIHQLKEKYDSFKTREAILKYEFQEKRKLLRRLRNQLEETREDWRLLRVKKRSPEDEQDDLLWSETLRRKFASKRKQPSEESGFIEAKDGREGLEPSDGPSNNLDNQQRDSQAIESLSSDTTRTTGYEDLAIALDNRRAKLDHLEDECYNLFASLSARSGDISRPKVESDQTDHRLVQSLANPLLFPDDITEGLLDGVIVMDDEEAENEENEDEDDDDLSDPLSDEFDELQLPVDTLDQLETIDNTEEADMSDLPWDSNNLYESRTASLLNEPNPVQSELQNTDSAPQTLNTQSSDLPSTVSATTFPSGRMVHIGVGMDDDDDDSNDDEYTQQEMESMAETGEPLLLCRLRRRAVEILVSRLRDEKLLHESRESELKEQLEELKELNKNLIKEVTSLKCSSFRASGWKIKMITSMMTTFLFASSLLVYFSK
uniref:Uncharacterized protein n=1 Tax=Tetranychus urticae TaxID=32264 RepID=T1K9U6_TETUR